MSLRNRFKRLSIWTKIPLVLTIISATVTIGSFLIDYGERLFSSESNQEKSVEEVSPFRFKIDDRSLFAIYTVNLTSKPGDFIIVGPYPVEPYLMLRCTEIKDPLGKVGYPFIDIEFAGMFGTNKMRNGGIAIGIDLKIGCGFSFKADSFQVMFEIVDDTFTNPQAKVAFRKTDGFQEGLVLREYNCIQDTLLRNWNID